jgi:hypothetical protein
LPAIHWPSHNRPCCSGLCFFYVAQIAFRFYNTKLPGCSPAGCYKYVAGLLFPATSYHTILVLTIPVNGNSFFVTFHRLRIKIFQVVLRLAVIGFFPKRIDGIKQGLSSGSRCLNFLPDPQDEMIPCNQHKEHDGFFHRYYSSGTNNVKTRAFGVADAPLIL